MDVLLINPFPKAKGINEATIEPPIGLAYLAAVLERDGFESSIIDANILRLENRAVLNRIKDLKPKLIGISLNVVTAASGIELSRNCKSMFPGIPVILGGPFPTSLPEATLKISLADGIVLGEGEETLLEVMRRHRDNGHIFKDIEGVIYTEKGDILYNKPRQLIDNLDLLPFPDYNKLPNLLMYKSRARKRPVAGIFTSRGCPFHCVYCNKNIFTDKFRKRSAVNVVEEIGYLVNKFNVRQIDILDDNFSLDLERAHRIFELLIEKKYHLAVNIQNGMRAEQVDEEIIRKMKDAGVFKVSFGVESGDERVLKIIKKDLDLDKVLEATRLMKEAGIIVYGNFMLGLPGDTKDSMQKTIDFAKKMNPDIANFMITIPFPGSELYDWIKKEGKFLVDIEHGVSSGFYGGQVFFALNGLDPQEVLFYYKKAYRDFYMQFSKIVDIIASPRSLYEIKWLIDGGVSTLRGLIKHSSIKKESLLCRK